MYRNAAAVHLSIGFKGTLKMKRKILFAVVILFLLGLFGCSKDSIISSYEVSYDDMYSRKHISELADSVSYGYGRNDDLTTALVYMYSNSEFRELYGEDFEFAPDDVVCYASEGAARFFLWNFKGTAEFTFKFKDASYHVKVDKDYGKKWEVTDCYSEEQDDSNSGDDSLS